MLPEYVVGLDVGQVHDYSAVVVLERRQAPTGRQEEATEIFSEGFLNDWRFRTVRREQTAGTYDIVHLERFALGLSYVDIPPRLHEIEAGLRQRWQAAAWEQDAKAGNGHPARYPHDAPVELVIDQTGVGRAVFDLLVESGLAPFGVTITGGDREVEVDHRQARVPKRTLAALTQVAMQTRRLRALDALPLWGVLRKELANFRAKTSLSGHTSFEAGDEWREGNHDDLVLAIAVALWRGEHLQGKAAGFVVG